MMTDFSPIGRKIKNTGGKKQTPNPSALPSPTHDHAGCDEGAFKMAVKEINPIMDNYDQKRYKKASEELIDEVLDKIYFQKKTLIDNDCISLKFRSATKNSNMSLNLLNRVNRDQKSLENYDRF